MQEKKITFLDFVWQKPVFSWNKTIQNKLKGCLSDTPLNKKKPLTKIWKTKQCLKSLTQNDPTGLMQLGGPEIFNSTINRTKNHDLTWKQQKKTY